MCTRTPTHTPHFLLYPPSIPNSTQNHHQNFRFSMHHPSPPHKNRKKITDPTTSGQPEAKAVEVGTTHFLAISKQDKVIGEMNTLTPEGGQETNPYPQPCRRGERKDSETWHRTVGRNRRGGRSQDWSPESTNDRHDMPDRVQVAEEDTLEDEQGYPYSSRGGDNDMLGNGRERLKRHRREVAGRVWIPEIWGKEELLKDWVDCTVFDSSLVRSKIMSAKAALVEEGTRASSPALPIENRCWI